MTHEEITEKVNTILTEVNELHGKEAQLKSEIEKHQEIIKTSEAEIHRCETEIAEIRANVKQHQIEMEKNCNELFQLPQDSAPNATAEADVDEQSKESNAKRLWNAQAKKIRERGVA
jgi:outer membrane murein-binding lipoprotein Lpp